MKYPGYDIKVLINGVHYATNGVDIDESAAGQNVADSEGNPGCAGGVGGLSYNISSGTNAINAVLTLATAPSPALVVGMQVTVAGASNATALDGVQQIQAVNTSANTITLSNPSTSGGNAGGGTITVGGKVSIGTQGKVAGTATATITIKKPTFDDAQNPYYIAALAFETQAYDRVQIYPQGVGASEPLWDFYSALCVRLALNNDVNTLEPLTITYESDGGYATPGQFA